jgi:hypothetical protein
MSLSEEFRLNSSKNLFYLINTLKQVVLDQRIFILFLLLRHLSRNLKVPSTE